MFAPSQIALQKRKELTKGDFRTKHSNWGHLLLGIGVLIAVEGPVNTYLRAGQRLLSSLQASGLCTASTYGCIQHSQDRTFIILLC